MQMQGKQIATLEREMNAISTERRLAEEKIR